MDEHFAALDALTRRAMQQELLSLWQQLRFTVLFVTHSIEEAMLIGSRILVLTPHPGRVRAELDADGFGFDSLDRVEFGAMAKRIHRLLFDPAPAAAGPGARLGSAGGAVASGQGRPSNQHLCLRAAGRTSSPS